MSEGVLVMAYGTPRRPDEVEAYYTDIRRGRPPTPELLADLRSRYDALGGVSGLYERTVAQQRAVAAALDRLAPGRFVVELGQKHAPPFVEDGVRALAARGVRRAVGLVLAPHYARASVGRYQERAAAAGAEAGVEMVPVESWHLLAAYLDFLAAGVRSVLAGLPERTKVLFTAHSLPVRAVAADDPYPGQLRATASAVAERAGLARWAGWSTCWQSAGRTGDEWLGPDVLAVIADLAATGRADGVAVCPCGFVADHLEVRYDLDLQAREAAERAGLAFARTPSVNDDPAVMAALAEVVLEAAGGAGR
ncbi:MAG TPA: ferrochelatase [Acidimicrobiales bacterium]